MPNFRGRRGSAQLGRFSPLQVSAVGAWYRFAASTAVAGEWQTVADVLGGAALVQNDTDRRLAADVAANGLPIGIYDGSDMLRMPLGANNFSTTKFGVAWWLKATDVFGPTIFTIYNNDAAVRVLQLAMSSGRLVCRIYIGSNVDGRSYIEPTASIAESEYAFVRLQFDSSKTAECDTDGATEDAKLRLFTNEVPRALAASNLGVGGTLSTLRTPTGAAIFGALNDADAPVGALAAGSVHGPNSYIFTDTPPAQAAANLMNFEVPT